MVCTQRSISLNVRDDYDVMLAAVRKNDHVLRLASDRLRADVRVVRAAVEQYDECIVHALGAARHDEAVNLAALSRSQGISID